MAVAWESSKRRDCPRRFSKRSASSPPRAHLPLSQIADDSFDVQLSQADESGKEQIIAGILYIRQKMHRSLLPVNLGIVHTVRELSEFISKVVEKSSEIISEKSGGREWGFEIVACRSL